MEYLHLLYMLLYHQVILILMERKCTFANPHNIHHFYRCSKKYFDAFSADSTCPNQIIIPIMVDISNKIGRYKGVIKSSRIRRFSISNSLINIPAAEVINYTVSIKIALEYRSAALP